MKKFILLVLAFVLSWGVNKVNANTYSYENATKEISLENSINANDESYVCTVIGWNNWDGREKKLNIYFRRAGNYSCYIAKEVYEDGSISSLDATVKLVTNPKYSNHYRYSAKVDLVGAYFFNTPKRLNESYISD